MKKITYIFIALFALLLLLPIVSAANLTDGLICYYPMNNLTDLAGTCGNLITTGSPTLSTGYDNTANTSYNFAPTASMVSTNNAGISGTTARTFAFWTKLNSTQNGQSLVTYGQELSGKSFRLLVDGGFYYFSGFSADFMTSLAPNTSWNYHVVTYDGTRVRWYVNNVLVGNSALTLNTVNSPIYAARSPSSVNGNLNGSLQRITIYNRNFTVSDVSALYNVSGNPYYIPVSNFTIIANTYNNLTLSNYTINITTALNSSIFNTTIGNITTNILNNIISY
jgi:hypothetical protein